ncbi:hypothetical protein EMPS_09642 [Entomortierella parvispora]|uniref:C2H2-type domain-containing protein n=1 Tax=Entomortierella parvispora TaxID=205924 RepID=A0A9P3HIY6_9FUNG|nr:hypothetical protein EMPS_09642 [Entomortierella parvispora]
MESSLFSDISITNRSGSSVSPFEDFDHSRFQDLEGHSRGHAQDQALVNRNGKRPCSADNHTKDTSNTTNTVTINNNNNSTPSSSLNADATRPPVNIVSNTFDMNDFDFLDAVPNMKWDWPEGDMSWDVSPPKQKIEALAQPLDVEYTPELSPAMSLCTPSVELINTPYPFDSAAFDEISASPSIWNSPSSPYEESFASDFSAPSSQQVSNSFDFDFSVEEGNGSAWQYDFQLFPDQSETAKLKSLMESHPAEEHAAALTFSPQDSIINSTSPVYELKQSPVEQKLDSFAKASPAMDAFPGTFTVAKILGQDVQAPGARVAPRKITQSPTKPGFQPAAKKRRRRVTSEEASRVVPADDPNGKARFQCSECDKTFSRPFNLRSHRATHAGVKPHACTHINSKGIQCHWTFARRHDLERHVRSRHSAEKMFTCKTCGARCGRNDAFKRHLARNAACTQGALDDDQDMDQCPACRASEEAKQSQTEQSH